MPNFEIGLSGLRVAQNALEITGTNLANSATVGYHRQDPDIRSKLASGMTEFPVGGVRMEGARRAVDLLLERELLQQGSLLAQVSQELQTLKSLESILGDLSTDGPMDAMTGFFNALRELAAQPDSQAFQEQAVWAADALANHFRSLGRSLNDLEQNIRLQAQGMVEEINTLTSEVASLNEQIDAVTTVGGRPNLVLDRRDQAATELAELTGAQPTRISHAPDVLDLVAWGTPLVVGNNAIEVEVGSTHAGMLGVSVKDAGFYTTDVNGGRLGGLLTLVNSILPELRTKLDTLAEEIIYNINAQHVQGVGPAGRFTSLAGWAVDSGQLDTWTGWGTHLQAGTLYVRVTDATAGSTTSNAVSIVATDTPATIAAKLDALDGLTATVADLALRIGVEDEARYSFDFLPVPITTLQGGWSGTSTPTVAGNRTPATDELFTCTVTAGGTVGLTGGLTVEVRNQAAELVATLNPGAGYPAGDGLEIVDGLYLGFDTGTLTLNDQFTVRTLAYSDSSGLLAAAGINTFFKGNSLATIAVDDEVMADTTRLASAVGADMNDNLNVRRMAELGEQQLSALGNLSPTDSYRLTLAGVGQRVLFSNSRQSGLAEVMQQLHKQRDEIGGVDINEEAAKMLMFEQMFQAMAKFVSSQERAMQALLELL